MSEELDQPTAHTRGTLLRGKEGAVYFLRDELLEACRVTGEELVYAEATLAAAEASPLGGSNGFVRYEGEMPKIDVGEMAEAADPPSTIMCCW
ncbi:hypothetical protein B4N89_32400 [Embleya scabrispora]|uniref:Uncharacterized protein n=1 Tax=Embleya scabrispora TaxID=159449 RepID=A0A1T3NQ10_9ACTN|nr:hypothetical protein [Embleya scabrispora]OPC78838.1 hypothetical protein B4N89_32400 [Embleya scabrispora]